jgi:NAD(P)-dependent dehydrogenase (short-subunit alcohol dehydrogenase family)
MARIFITGSSDGLGRAAADVLLAGGHQVIVHARSRARLEAVRELLDRGASSVVGDLADLAEVRDIAAEVNEIGAPDAVIHNAGVLNGPALLTVNAVAPYLLTALINRPHRLIYISSSMHMGGRARLPVDWRGHRSTVSYADTKLFVTTLAAAVARIWPSVISNAVDPGWVPTKMGGASAPDDLRLGHLTQEWLATSEDADARSTGGYWRHQRRLRPHPSVADVRFQDDLLDALGHHTGIALKSAIRLRNPPAGASQQA